MPNAQDSESVLQPSCRWKDEGSITVVLVEPSHPGNIGAAARAMKTMGFRHLSLVNPKQFPDQQASALAAGAADLLEKTKIFTDLKSAIAEHVWVVGVSARLRDVEKLVLTPRRFASDWIQQAESGSIALVFGNEQSGLSNEELALCHLQVCIPTAKDYGSLNLAQAVQVLCYELSQHVFIKSDKQVQHLPADQAVFEGMFAHWCEVLEAVNYLHPKQRQKMLIRMRKLLLRAAPSDVEVTLLRGAFRNILRHIK